jgi:hypothetical protein
MTAAAKKQTKAEPQPAASTAQAPKPMAAAPTAQPQPASKQLATVAKLKAAWTEKGVDLSKLTEKQDGKFVLLQPTPQWPLIRIGASGGIELPEIKSYPRAFDAAINGKELLEKQTARAAKKTAASAAPAAKPQSAPAGKPETPAAKKHKANAAIEAQLEARA